MGCLTNIEFHFVGCSWPKMKGKPKSKLLCYLHVFYSEEMAVVIQEYNVTLIQCMHICTSSAQHFEVLNISVVFLFDKYQYGGLFFSP